MTIASQIDRSVSASGFGSSPGRDSSSRAFRAAMRHSRRVRLLRVGIPMLIVAGIAAFTVYRWIDPMQALARLPVSVDGMVVSGTKIIMRQPRLTGHTKDERPYTVTARSAAKDLAKPDALELEEIRTTISLSENNTVQVTAAEGYYDAKAETLRLQHNVVVSSNDYEIVLREALVHVRGGSVVSEQPVEVRMLQGNLKANRLEVRESGAVIRFEQGVTLEFDATPSNPGAAEAAR